MLAGTFKSAIVLSVVAFFANVNGVPTSGGNSQCDTKNMKCCGQVLDSNSTEAQEMAGSLGLDLAEQLLGNLGFGCTLIGTGSGANCVQQPVCCNSVSQDGLINVGCTPINLDI